MFYRIVALALVGLGIYNIVSNLTLPLVITPESLEKSARGLATIFLGLLNLAYFYEKPDAAIPKLVLLAANLMFIGFTILLITSEIGVFTGYSAAILSVINCVMVLNHKV